MRIIQLSVFALSLSAIVGCKAIDAMDNTTDMKKDLAGMKQTTSGMATTTNDMNETTKELKRKASLGEGLKLIDAPENQQEFAPPSKGLLAGAKLVAENMTSEELVKFYQAGLKQINNTTPKEIERDRTLLGEFSPRYVFAFNEKKQVQVVTLKAIAALIPDDMIKTIIREQFQNGGGAQARAASALLMMRASFISDFFLTESVFETEEQLDNMGKLRNAFKYAKQLQFLAELPNADKISFKTRDGAFMRAVVPSEKVPFVDEECKTAELVNANPQCKASLGDAPSFNEQLDVKIAKPWFKKIAKRIDSELPDDIRGGTSPYAREVAEIKAECLRYVEGK